MSSRNQAILCVDDDETVLLSIRDYLSQWLEQPVMVEVVESGEEALEVLDEFEEDGIELVAVVSDYIMPGMRGDEVLARIHQRHPQVVKIMLTGQSDLQGVTNAINRANLYRFLEKPWRDEDLLLTVKGAIQSYSQAQELERSNRQLRELNENLEQLVRARTKALEEKQLEVRRLLDNSGQGFLSFGEDLQVAGEPSRECYQLLGEQVSGRIEMLLAAGKDELQATLVKTLRLYFLSDDPLRQELALNLLPTEYHLNDLVLRAEYRPIEGGRLMLILSDISHEKCLQQKIVEEQQRFRFIVAVLREIDDVQQIVAELRQLLHHSADESLEVVELYRQIHTFKGIFSQFDFPSLPQQLHQLEGELRLCQGSIRLSELPDFEQLEVVLEKDLLLLEQILGDYFSQGEKLLRIPESRIHALEVLAIQLSRTELADQVPVVALIRRVRTLRYVDLRFMLKSYPKLVAQLAERVDKQVLPFTIQGDEISVDPLYFGPLVKSLVHLFRNAVVHGIETPERRVDIGKPEAGEIRCLLQRCGASVQLEVSDDGVGIDWPRLQQQALEQGLLSEESSSGLDSERLSKLIFSDQLSTSRQINEFSGRGVGLAAVRAEIERLGGRIEVNSRQGQGSTFRCMLPLTGRFPIEENIQ